MDNNKSKFALKNLTPRVRITKTMLNVIFIPAIFIITILTIFSYYQTGNLLKTNSWVTHTYEVIQAVDRTLYNVVNMESRQRAYLITGDEQYIADMDAAQVNLRKNLDELGILTKDNPMQRERVLYYIEATNQRLNVLSQVTQLKFSNKIFTPGGLDVFRKGQEISNHVKNLGQEIKSVELVLLNDRNKTVIETAKVTNIVIIVGSIISLFSLIVAFLLSNYELSMRRKIERKRKMVEARLRGILESATDMIAALDLDHRYIIFNEAYQTEFKRLFNKSIKVGMHIDEFFSAKDEKNPEVLLWKNSLKQNEFTKNLEFTKDHEKNIYEVTANDIKNEKNELYGSVQIIRNITKRIAEQVELKESYEKLDSGMRELQSKNEQITLLVEMSDIMLACNSQEELTSVLQKYCQRMLSFGYGALYLMHPSKNYLEMANSWGLVTSYDTNFIPEECWALRLGRIHFVKNSDRDLVCPHVKPTQNISFICVPLMAQNDIYGLLYVEALPEHAEVFSEDERLFINAFAELTALALANVRLRENLRYQSMRDPLTGLYNRRYLEDFLFKQVHQAERSGCPLAVLMLDLDHFKKINDTYGHEAGDTALKELGRILQSDIRLGDIAARYGGEEFIIIFYNIDLEEAKFRAEQIRKTVSLMQIKYGAEHVGSITISIGIAEYPQDARTPTELIEFADKALYRAKKNGRNKIVVYSEFVANAEKVPTL
jgi:diguanylate cyclase (GGDEF)-like protein/PAS domain S-box-containing protein